MAIWNNRQESNTTSWGRRAGYQSGSSLLGDFDQNAYNEGQYTSASQASSGLVGTKYFLLDDKPFTFGTSTDFMVSYDAENEQFQWVGREFNVAYPKGYIDRTVLKIDKRGKLQLRDHGTVALSIPSAPGQIAYTNNKLYISTN